MNELFILYKRIKKIDKLLVCDGATVIVQTYVNNLAFS